MGRCLLYTSSNLAMADFAAAQQRILARRAARDAQASASQSLRNQERTNRLLGLPPALRVLAHQTWNLWDDISNPYGTRPAFRVGQVDAELLDEELLELLKNQAGEGLKLFGAHLKDDWSAEIGLALRAIVWKLSIWDHGASYGASLQGLQYVDARESNAAARTAPKAWQKIAYGLLTVGGRYGWSRWEDYLSSTENSYDAPSTLIQKLSRFTTLAGTTHEIAAFASFLIFLYNGKYRTITDRLLRLRLVPSSNQTNREVSFEYLNRQLVWHAFTEFLLFLLPLVGISRWRRWLARAWKKTKDAMRSEVPVEDEEVIKTGPLAFLPERTCAICYQDQNPASTSEAEILGANVGPGGGVIGSATTDVVNPYETIPCGCIYCFVCIATKIEAEEGGGWPCLRCGEIVYKCQAWDGDVVVQKKSISKTGKSVGFSVVENEQSENLKEGPVEDDSEMVESTLTSSQWSMPEESTSSG